MIQNRLLKLLLPLWGAAFVVGFMVTALR